VDDVKDHLSKNTIPAVNWINPLKTGLNTLKTLSFTHTPSSYLCSLRKGISFTNIINQNH
jgi:hypothetical protein